MSKKVKVTVRLSAPLSERIGSRGEIEVTARDIKGSLLEVAESYPKFSKLIWSDTDQINSALLVFYQDEKINDQALNTLLKEHDQIDVIPAISGG